MTTPLPLVPAFPAGYGPQQSDFQSWWVNAATFFQQRVVFRAAQESSSTTLPSSGDTAVIAFDTVIEDPYGGWNSEYSHWLAPSGLSGWYNVTLTVIVSSPGATQVVLIPSITNSGGLAGGYPDLTDQVLPDATGGASCEWLIYLTGGQDSVQAFASVQNSSSDVDTAYGTAGQESTIEIMWLST